MRQAFFPRTRRGLVVRLAIVALVVLFVAFEIGVRLLTPDAVHYTTQVVSPTGQVFSSTSGTITDPAVVAHYRAAMTAKPTGRYVWQTWRRVTCAGVDPYSATYTFLWHGLPIEVIMLAPTCGDNYEISQGGLPDPQIYDVPHP